MTCVAAAVGGCGDIIIPADPDGSTDGGSIDGSLDDGGEPIEVDCAAQDGGHPVYLQCSGLYADWKAKKVAPDARAYAPAFPLWADGAEKLRWIYLPPTKQIDATDPNEWVFPIGTKIWQEFRLLGKRIETRFLWKVSDIHWFRTTYEWNEAETEAIERVTGRTNVGGLGYEIASTDQCAACHAGRKDFVLGLEFVSMSNSTATGLRIDILRNENLIANAPATDPQIPGVPATAAALGYLHANCGVSCHSQSPRAAGAASGLFLRLEVAANGALPADENLTSTYVTAVRKPSSFTPAGEPAGSFLRVKPQDVAHSSIAWRAGRRDSTQMPPLVSHLVDKDGLTGIELWINSLTP